MSKNSIVQKKDIKVGKSFWFICRGHVVKGIVTKQEHYHTHLILNIALTKNLTLSWIELSNDRFFTGDRGIINPYDCRPAQVFTNRRAAQFFADHWRGMNPNFIVCNPKNNQTVIYDDSPYHSLDYLD